MFLHGLSVHFSVLNHVVCQLIALWDFATLIVDVDVGIHGNHPSSSNRAPAVQPYGVNSSPHIYSVSYAHRPRGASLSDQPPPGDVTSSRQRRDSLPRDERHVTFADDSSVMAGRGDVGGRDTSRYGSSEFSDVTSVTSGSYYMDEDSHQLPVSFIFV